MSFLTRTTLRTASRAQFISATTPRVFSTSFLTRKSATEAVKDTVKTVDRAVSDKLVDGIELSQTAAEKAREVAGMSKGEAMGKASEVAGEARGKASEVAGEAQGKASELQGKASELTGQTKGKANELAGEAKGKVNETKGNL